MPEYIEPKDVADYLGVNVQTVYRWMGTEALPYYVFGVRSTKVSKTDLKEFIARSRRGK